LIPRYFSSSLRERKTTFKTHRVFQQSGAAWREIQSVFKNSISKLNLKNSKFFQCGRHIFHGTQ